MTTQDTLAPELLPALIALVASIEKVDFSPLDGVYDQIPWSQAEAAIAKARELARPTTCAECGNEYTDKHAQCGICVDCH